jgi:benzoate/toluate 1,2-dioxygenase reductase component
MDGMIRDLRPGPFAARILSRRWLSPTTFELSLERPAGFDFQPGQRVRLENGPNQREYSIAAAPGDPDVVLCIRRLAAGAVSAWLSTAGIGTMLHGSGPHGYFTFKPSPRPAIFVATGTGVAPFVSMAKAGTKGFTLLHGVRRAEDLFYRNLLTASAHRYLACLSEDASTDPDVFAGRVTRHLERQVPPEACDFYLCGRREMIRDVTWLIDDRFCGSRVYSEIFY